MIKVLPSKTAKEVVARERERKARTTLLMALPEDHLAKFHKMDDAKEILEAIKSRFSGNDKSKKMQKYLLKQHFEGFLCLPQRVFIKGLDTLSFDDLYNNLKVFERDVKGTTASSSNTQNVAFVSADNTSSINDVSTIYNVSSPFVSKSQKEGSSSYTDEVIHSFFENQSMDMISMRIKKFHKRTGRKLQFDTKDPVDFDKTKVECFNCHKMRHFARGCKAKGNQDNKRRDAGYNGNTTRDNGRRPAYQDDSKALVTIDGEDIDWSGHVEENAQIYAMMAYSSSNLGSDNESVFMNKEIDLEIDYSKFTYGPKQTSVDELDSKPSEYASCESDSSVETITSMLDPVKNAPKVVCEPKVWTDAPIIEEYELDSDNDLVSNVQEDKEKPSFAFTDSVKHVKTSRENVKESGTPNHSPKIRTQGRNGHIRKGLGYAFTRKACFVCGSFSHLIRDCDFHIKRMTKQAELTKSKNKDDPHRALKDKGVVDSGCSRHMTWNKAHCTDYQEFKGGYVAFGGSNGRITGKGKIKAGKLNFEDVYYVEELTHYNLFSVSQMCDKKNKVLFIDTDCLVMSYDFKLPDENHVLLKITREHNMYIFNLKNIEPFGDLACLFAKALIDKSNKWHRRLGHVNFKNLNKLVKGNLVRGLPSKIFENDHTCVSCHKGKQHKASCKAKTLSFMNQPLHILHMDLFGPTSVRSINHKTYCLVITNGFSRFSWVYFLKSKDETTPILKDFIRQAVNQFNHKVKTIRSDNETEFKNNKLIELCGLKGIKKEYMNARTPQQNRVVERKNITFIEAARTMVLVTKPQNKTPYELLSGKQPIISYLRPFGCHVTILNTIDQLGKFDGKSDRGFLVGYSLNSKDFKEKEANDAARKETTHENQNAHTNNTNLLNTISTPLSAAGPSRAFNVGKLSYPDDPSMPQLEDIYASPSKGISTESSSDDEGVVYKNKKDERGVVVRNKARLVAQGHRQEEGIDYDVVFAPVARIEAIRIFLAFDSYMGFIVYQIDMKSAFLYGIIDEEVYVTQPPGFVDPKFPNKVYKVVKALYGLHQAPRACVKTASTPIETQKPLVKDEEAIDVDVTPKTLHLQAVKRIFRYLKGQQKLGLYYPKVSSFDLEAYSDNDYIIVATSTTEAEYVAAAHYCGQVLWIQNQLLDYGFNIMNTKIYIDNKSTICIVKNPVFHSMTKHIEITHHFIKDAYEKKLIQDVIRQAFHLEDADRVECFPNKEIFTELARIGYEKPPPKLTFYKAFFSAQWKFLIHTLVHMVRNVDSPTKFLMYPWFLQVIINAQVDDLSSHNNQVETPLFATMLVQPQPLAAVEEDEVEVPNAPTPPSPTTTSSPPPQDPIPTPSQAQPATPSSPPQEQQTKTSKSSIPLLNTLLETCAILEEEEVKVFWFEEVKKGGKIAKIDADEDITLVDMETQVDMDAELQGRIDDVSAATKDVNDAEPTVFNDEKVTMEVEQAAAREKQEKDDLEKSKRLQQQYEDKQEYIDWNVIAEQIQENHLDNIRKYQSLKRKPISIAHARKNMIIYLKNMTRYKMEDFRGMTYDRVRPIFEREYNKVQTLFKPDKDVEEPQKKRVVKETLLQESFKKLKAIEVSGSESTQDTPTNDPKEMREEDVQNMLEIIPLSKFKVEALQVKVGGITEAYQSFKDMLKGFDREDLVSLWSLVKEKFSTAVPIVDKEKALWVELTRLFEPNADDVLWKLQRYMHYPLTWKLYTNCRVHHVSSIRRHDIFMLTEKDYTLSNAVMIMMLSAKLQVEEDNEMAKDLVMKIFMEANKPKSRSLDTSSK
nr:putative ribonuclease H-like domain-containing protein [Tanacetum cinerariifolium]